MAGSRLLGASRQPLEVGPWDEEDSGFTSAWPTLCLRRTVPWALRRGGWNGKNTRVDLSLLFNSREKKSVFQSIKPEYNFALTQIACDLP